ncbi:glycerophosphodiester phosphodiesterase [Legionella cardiaca]|uniref:Glycerophosphodiester phosphodiesterase family protein n=1 Tax=Legionella cardiaca TaxID=1071983 RepID=A0ABY8ARA7_9GAMM|nr:glycerophosphodiester phosphodiesterase family protein [Legionella cardiaca]WED42974.1 glycerophosphodiester phosphodiesterase family protein [Legionella cardiaca]
MTLLNLLGKSIDYYFSFLPRKKPLPSLVAQANLIAHRGAHDKNRIIIENTHAAFNHALNLGCWGIEFDLQETADEVLVVNHDPTLRRLWQKDVAIKELTFQTLRKLVPQVPSLAEVIENYGKRMHLFIELKAPLTSEMLLIDALRHLTPCEDYHLLSLDETIFASLQYFPKKALLLVAGHNNVKKFCQLSLEKHYGGVLGHYLLLNKNLIKRLEEREDQIVGVGMIASKFGLYRELNRDIQWLFSDNVALMSAYLRALKEEARLNAPPTISE